MHAHKSGENPHQHINQPNSLEASEQGDTVFRSSTKQTRPHMHNT